MVISEMVTIAKNANKFLSVTLFLMITVFMSSCIGGNEHRVFEENKEIKNGVWNRSEFIDFEVEIDDTLNSYNLFYNVRNTIDYPFSNLYLRMIITDSSNTETYFDQEHELFLFDHSGKPAGKTGFFTNQSLGDLFDHRYPAGYKVTFPQPGKYNVRIKQFMRSDDFIPEIVSVGLRVDKTK